MRKIQTILCGSLAVLALAACSNEDNEIIIGGQHVTTENKVWNVTTEASFSSEAETRALSEETENAITGTFATTEHVYVYNASNSYTLLGGSLQPQTDGASATLKGTLTGTIANDNSLKLIYPQSTISYTGQKGTLADIAANYDFATAMVSVSDASTPSVTTSAASFTRQQAITKFTFSTAVKSLTISGTGLVQSIAADGTETTGDIDVTLATASKTVYVAMRNSTNAKQTYTFTATSASGYTYTGTKKANLAAGKNYTASVTLVPVGAISGQFYFNSINNRKIYFSKGNLQATYNGRRSWTWSFAQHQYDYIGDAPGNTSITEYGETSSSNVTVDLFGWSTWMTTYGISNYPYDNGYLGSFEEWGNNRDLQTTLGSGWRTLTKDEWVYVFNSRPGATVNSTNKIRFVKATINTDGTSVKGVILFPDGITVGSGEMTSFGTLNGRANDYTATCTTSQWTALETKGCVFLPAAGFRYKSFVNDAGSAGFYWSKTADSSGTAFDVLFTSYSLYANNILSRCEGASVRLVRSVE